MCVFLYVAAAWPQLLPPIIDNAEHADNTGYFNCLLVILICMVPFCQLTSFPEGALLGMPGIEPNWLRLHCLHQWFPNFSFFSKMFIPQLL